jgi:3D (Asp-Asp-Asp) domain-containing protein
LYYRLESPTAAGAIYNWRVIISGSFWRKTVVTVLAAGAFVSTYEVTILDSKYAVRQAMLHEITAPPAPGSRLAFSATAYCKGITTASGATVQTGVVASDPSLLPVGSVIQVDSLRSPYNGIYTVLDTGPAVQGRLIDIYMWSCYEALEFGRQPMRLTVLRLGWNPRATAPSFFDRLFKPRAVGGAGVTGLPSRPFPQDVDPATKTLRVAAQQVSPKDD